MTELQPHRGICAGPGCDADAKAGSFFCEACWQQTPADLQEAFAVAMTTYRSYLGSWDVDGHRFNLLMEAARAVNAAELAVLTYLDSLQTQAPDQAELVPMLCMAPGCEAEATELGHYCPGCWTRLPANLKQRFGDACRRIDKAERYWRIVADHVNSWLGKPNHPGSAI